MLGFGFMVLVLLPACASSQTFPFQFYTTADGLAQSNVSTIFQDSRGYIWFGTSGGITRYDGNKFWSYKNGAFRVLSMTEDSTGKYWIGTTSGLACLRFPDTTFQWLRASDTLLPSNLVLALLTDRHDNLWIGTDAGLLCLPRSGGHLLFNHANGLLHNYVHSIVQDSGAAILVGSGGGIQRITLSGNHPPRIDTLCRLAAGKLAMLRSGDLIVSDLFRRSVFLWSKGALRKMYSAGSPGTGTYPTAFNEDPDGNIWIGTTNGIAVLEDRKTMVITRREGLQNSFINTIVKDREGNLWFGTEGGAAKHPYELSNIYNSVTGLPEDHVIAIFLDSHRNTWIGTYDGAAVISAEGGIRTFGIAEGLPHLSVHDFCEDADGNVWIGTYGGLRIFSHGKIRLPDNPRLRSTRIIRLLREDNGTIWCGGDREILQVSRDGKIRAVVDRRTITRSNVSALYKDSKGRLWFGTDDEGAGCLQGGRISMFDENAGLPDLWVMSIVEDRHHQIWMTTQKGVVQWNGSHFEPIPAREDPLRNDAVTFGVRDSAGHLWFGTQHGVYEWDDSLIGHWDMQSGIAADAVRRGYVDRTGQIWIGTVGGASKLNLRTLQMHNGSPPVYLEGIETERNPGYIATPSQLDYEDNTLVFHFNALSFIDEHRTEFRWMLAGFDQTWQPAANGRAVRYTHLPPGSYEFLVSARNRGTSWAEPARFRFSINPPFWGTWWFVSLSSIASLGIVVGLIRRRFRSLDKERRRQQEFAIRLIDSQENERKRIANELHDSLGQDLLVIRNRALLGLKDPHLAENGRTQLEHISSVATEAINDVREISYNLRPYQLDRLGLTKAIRSLAQGVSDSTSLSLTMQIDSVDSAIVGDGAIHLYRIVQEGINNILKHSTATEAALSVSLEPLHVRIIIRDNGKGFSKERVDDHSRPRGLGLIGIAERTKALNGQFTVESTPGKGSTLTILIPRSKA
ncbi:MAG: two-component regulator propeller domain-containing protein [Bacteroidota bacterium]